MSHQRYPSIDPVKEPHSVSLKVLRLSRPSLVAQHPLQSPFLSSAQSPHHDTSEATALMPASLAYGSTTAEATNSSSNTNSAPFLLAPILNLPPSFGSAYVGETFSCTLCANHDIPPEPEPASGGSSTQLSVQQQQQQQKKRFIRDVRIEAEMKTPGSGSAVQKLVLGPSSLSLPSGKHVEEQDDDDGGGDGETKKGGGGGGKDGTDLDPGQTLQRIVNFDLKEEGNHVLAVTVSYYEATETSGRTRTFRKLYQFICKGSLIVRTKISPLPLPLLMSSSPSASLSEKGKKGKGVKGKSKPKSSWKPGRSWAMEAQLENCSEDVMQLERVGLDLEPGLRYADCNYWGSSGASTGTITTPGGGGVSGNGAVMNNKPVLHPGEVEQCCFVVAEEAEGAATLIPEEWDGTGGGRVVFGVLGIGWRSEMGNKGFLTTGKLGTRVPGAPPATTAAR
ncbi:hypothetical protein SLS62_002254 [Diatrype stigma]|uniref:Trafficking protein particle complex subunit 13 N-terminal domain-containing protein n=1 Tax=Diatrype stigma TaxID=117547 RepID=A0AAN9YV99_9PEZI